MNRRPLFAFIVLLGLAWAQAQAATLDKDTIKRINAATFEVVVPKPGDDGIRYEKPLPMDLLPFTVRNDKYYSIGTAFAISDRQLVSAAHVFRADVESQYGAVYVRDNAGKVYEVDKILKYSNHRDFVLFTLKDKRFDTYYEINTDAELNEDVFAVGNALGEGVVIRDGLYTSNTPEQQDGAWNWIRFSAAASPGNSGGPLIDHTGRVIGIVERKSQNENLNYALPIGELLKAPENRAVYEQRSRYRLDNMPFTDIRNLKKDVELPLRYEELNKRLTAIIAAFYEEQVHRMLADNDAKIFPKSPGSYPVLYRSYTTEFPHIVGLADDDTWTLARPRSTVSADLGNNGRLTHGDMGSYVYMRLVRPDNVAAKDFYTSASGFMDLILKGFPSYRWVGPEKIKILSLGEPIESYDWVDKYRRKWQVRNWNLPYGDVKITTFALPLPDGYAIVFKGTTTDKAWEFIRDLKVLVDFCQQSYGGTLKQWREFLAIRDLAPTLLTTSKIEIDADKISYTSPRLRFAPAPEILPISDKSRLALVTGFLPHHDGVSLDISDILLSGEEGDGAAIAVQRKIRPPQQAREQYQQDWERVAKHMSPYNGDVLSLDGRTVISAVMEKGTGTDAPVNVLYTVSYTENGSIAKETMETKLGGLRERVNILE